ncbi:MAG TPA: winged helix-turn-helix domain-containing protein [Steroidobacteraceae bacterium]|jgi:TolB-like protein/DNA-binding winged helix-turn-helix (wHTH) protein|nr:winged helix-turn-helix domain-containing protein [Steroidobacteraceae bacterium]
MAFLAAEPAPGSAPAVGCYRIDDLLIDARARRVTRDGIDLVITSLSFDLLLALVCAAPDLVTFDAIMGQVWPGVVVSPETITQRVKLVRQALGDSADHPRYIFAVRGHGYRMSAAAVPQVEIEPERSALAPPTSSERLDRRRSGETPPAPATSPGRRAWAAAAVLTVVLTAAGLWWGLERPAAVRAPIAPAETAAGAGSSIAVMPFANLTGEPAKDYLGDGMAEELIDALTRVPGIRVLPRAATFAYRGHTLDIGRIAQVLAVATVLEGGVRSAGEHIRVSVRLVDARSGATIWSQNYDRPLADLFKLQDDLADETVQALHGYLGIALPTAVVREPPTRDIEAYRLYLQARAVARGSHDSQAQGLALVNQALARDPNFARALAYRAFNAGNGAALGYAIPKEALDAAQRDAMRALRLSPGLADALANLGSIHIARGEWVEGEMSYRAAIAADPDNVSIRNQYTLVILRPTGRLQEAYSQLNESYRLAPAEGYTIHELALINSLLGRDAEALRFLRLHEELGGGGQTIGNVLVYTRAAARSGHYQDAIDHSAGALPETVSTVDGVPLMKTFYSGLADPTQNAAARRAFQSLAPKLWSPQIDGQVRGFFVQSLTMLGALDEAYDIASRSVDEGVAVGMVGSRIYLADLWLPEMRPFRRDARFSGLVRRLGLFDYWQKYGPPDGCELRDRELHCH